MRSALILLTLFSLCFGAAKIDSIEIKKARIDSTNGRVATLDSAIIKKYIRFDTLSQHAENGAIWNDVNHRAIESWTNGMEGIFGRTIFDVCNNPQDTNSTAEISLKGYDSTDANANDSLSKTFFKKFKMLYFNYSGMYTTKNAPSGTLIIRLKLNSVVICSTVVTLDPSEADNNWNIVGTLICKSTGTTGKISGCTGFDHGQVSGASNIQHKAPMISIRGGVTVNTNIKLKQDITAQFSNSTTNMILVCSGYWIERH